MNKAPKLTPFSSVWQFLATGFGSGLSPKAPGTVGTLAAIPLYFAIIQLPLWAYGAAVVLAAIAGIVICQRASDELGVHDHPGIVWDEFVGLWIALFAIPDGLHWVCVGFALFRFFDIVKPQPIGYLDKHVHGGLGIMVDDVVAGIMACCCVHILVYFV